MARKKPTPSLDPLTSLLPRDHIEAEASRFGVFRRKPRKIDLYLLVWTLIIGLPKGPKRTLDGLRVAYEEATGQRLARSSFYTRLNKELAKLMKSLVVSTLETCQAGYDLPGGFLAGFVDVLALTSETTRASRHARPAPSGWWPSRTRRPASTTSTSPTCPPTASPPRTSPGPMP